MFSVGINYILFIICHVVTRLIDHVWYLLINNNYEREMRRVYFPLSPELTYPISTDHSTFQTNANI